MAEQLCICCYDPVTAENGDPLYLQATAGMPDAAPAAWVHKNCLADYARPFAFGDLSQSELAELREFARNSNQ